MPTAKATKRRYLAAIGLGLIGLVLALPTLAALTGARNSILNLVIQRPALQAKSAGAALGWFSHQQFFGLQVQDAVGGFQLGVSQIRLDRNLCELVFRWNPGGELLLDQPQLTITVDKFVADVLKPAEAPPKPGDKAPAVPIALFLRKGNVLIRDSRQSEPLMAFDNFDLRLRVEPHGEAWDYVAEPATILDHTEVTAELCHRSLQFFAPILANAADTSGNVSLRLTNLRLPLKVDEHDERQLDVDGELDLHRVSLGARNPIIMRLTDTVSRMLGRPIPNSVKLADESRIRFHMGADGVVHEGLAFGLPEISPDLQIRTSGRVGLDRSLALNVEVPIPLTLIREGPLMKKLSERPLQFVVRGTLDEPIVGLPDDRQWYDELLGRLLQSPGEGGVSEAKLEPLAEALTETLGELIQRRNERWQRKAAEPPQQPAETLAEPTPSAAATPLMDRLRAWRERRKGKPATLEAPPTPPTTTGPAKADEKKTREF